MNPITVHDILATVREDHELVDEEIGATVFNLSTGASCVARESERRSWRAMVRRQKTSGLSVHRFCRREGLGESTYHFWKKKLKRRDGDDASRHSQAREPRSVPHYTSASDLIIPTKNSAAPRLRNQWSRCQCLTACQWRHHEFWGVGHNFQGDRPVC